MKIISLHLENYQAHVDTTIHFVDGLNVIVGPTDVGKSSIIRALLKVIRDTPVGKGFIHTGQDTCVLTLVFENTGAVYTLIRTVSATKNGYSIQKAGEAAVSFDNFGREIPQEVRNALSMSLVQLENNETIDLHFAEQHDLPFMLTGTGSLRSRLLGRIAGLHILGKATIAASKDERHAGTEITHITSDCDQLSKEIASMPDVAKLETDVKKFQLMLTEAKTLNTRLEYLQGVFTELNSIKTLGRQLAQDVKALPELNIDFTELRGRVAQLVHLTQLRDALNAMDTKINALHIPAEINVDFTTVGTLITRLAALQKFRTQLHTLDEGIAGIDLSVYDAKEHKATALWYDELNRLGICPTCKQPITQVHIHG